MGGKHDLDTGHDGVQQAETPDELCKIESSMTMDRFAGLELRLDTPKGTDLLRVVTAFLSQSPLDSKS